MEKAVHPSLWKRLRLLLTPSELRRGRAVSLTVFLTAVLDFVGLAALLPGLLYLLDGGEGRSRAVWFCLAAVLLIAAKNGVAALLTRYQSAFLLDLYRRLSLALFSNYYHRGLLYIRERGAMRLSYEVNYLCYALTFNVLGAFLRMLGSVLLIAFVTLALLVYSPGMTLLLYGSFVPLVAAYVILVRSRVRAYGEQDLEERRRQSRLVVETMRGYPELELSGAFPSQYRRMDDGFNLLQKVRLRLQVVQSVPLFLSELTVALGLLLLVACTQGDVHTSVGIFAVAAFRLLPSMRGLLNGWTQIQNSLYSLEVVEEGLNDALASKGEEGETPATFPFEREILLDGISFAYLEDQPVLTDFSATIRKGEFVGVSGPSGVGKSTLFNLLMGLIPPCAGQVRIDGVALTETNRAAWQRRIGYVAQDVFVARDTLARNIALGQDPVDFRRAEQVLRQACLGGWLDALPSGLSTLMGEDGTTLSGGQKQRLGIARALYKQADVLLLDEATSALDTDTERSVNQTLRQLKTACPGLTVVVIAHRESTLAYCERILRID